MIALTGIITQVIAAQPGLFEPEWSRRRVWSFLPYKHLVLSCCTRSQIFIFRPGPPGEQPHTIGHAKILRSSAKEAKAETFLRGVDWQTRETDYVRKH